MSQTPKHYQRMRQRYPQLLDAVGDLGRAVREAGPLAEKEIQLVQLAAAAAVKSEGGVHSHARRAMEAGATAEEVRHALLILISTLGYPNVAAAMSWADDVIEGGGS
ncbi:MAG: carboxymuconolactone decarboxylase family protein [Desulfohalobiaceae bacterium]|nr:carboxymuconolactone decarboxylase family protein [Desulfohalobiaceae bacterium]MCF8086318.1 carboxymuconolactone decarboxylase family protein [Desulfohalobiaceae bacterium]